ncbi:MAG: membrane protein insertion efficiency factor YidD, partial [Desulfosudaceae bacterium]
RCAMYPTCSQYSRQAFDRHGLLPGWILTCDRLLRCGRDELSLAPIIFVDGQRRSHDPLEANDYWWAE